MAMKKPETTSPKSTMTIRISRRLEHSLQWQRRCNLGLSPFSGSDARFCYLSYALVEVLWIHTFVIITPFRVWFDMVCHFACLFCVLTSSIEMDPHYFIPQESNIMMQCWWLDRWPQTRILCIFVPVGSSQIVWYQTNRSKQPGVYKINRHIDIAGVVVVAVRLSSGALSWVLWWPSLSRFINIPENQAHYRPKYQCTDCHTHNPFTGIFCYTHTDALQYWTLAVLWSVLSRISDSGGSDECNGREEVPSRFRYWGSLAATYGDAYIYYCHPIWVLACAWISFSLSSHHCQ